MKRLYLTCAIIAFVLSADIAYASELRIKTNRSELESEYIYAFDERVISGKVLRKYFEINPSACNPRLYLASQLELCIDNDPKYLPCGSRNIHDRNFLKNALVNINEAKRTLQYQRTFNEIKELKPLVDYFIDSLQFSLWMNESEYKFYQTWNTNDLKKRYRDLDPLKICPEIISQIERANSIDQKYALSEKWQNALNREYRKDFNEGSLKKIWDDFMKTYHIKERVIVLEEP